MNREEAIKFTEDFVRQRMEGFDSGHDWWHTDRVRKLALFINEQELIADKFTLEIAALLHDTVDSKFFKEDTDTGYRLIEEFMDNTGLIEIKAQVIDVIRNVSFSNKNSTGNKKDPVLLILQDADRIDAIGAIGIARAFNYGGFRNNPIYIPGEKSDGNSNSTIGHFYDKLLKLKAMMNTPTGSRMAEVRHNILEKFLEQFYLEWEAEY
ncbi:MAG: HD domain-containing protein [Bacteroidetes bacterium]|nr:MAG: HD domain-containing protein [Bacteroidota bacterium]